MFELSTVTKSRFQLNLKEIKQSPGWRFVRQLATAEASYPEPNYDGLKAYILGEFEKAIDEEIANGIARQKGQAQKPVYPGAAR